MHVEAQALGLEAQVKEFLVLVAVADQAGLGIAHEGNGGNEFGLGADLETVMIAGPELGNLFHHLLLLVDLDGKDAAILPLVAQGLDGLAEGVVNIADARIQNIFHAQQHRHVIAARMQARDDFGDGNLRSLGTLRADDHLALFGHVEIACPPVADSVQFHGIFHTPLLQCAVFCQDYSLR